MLYTSNKIYKEILRREVCYYQGDCLICPVVHIYLRCRQNISFSSSTKFAVPLNLYLPHLCWHHHWYWRDEKNLGLGITLPFEYACISLKLPSYLGNEYSVNTCMYVCQRERIAVIWISCGVSPVVTFHCSSFVHFSNHVKNFPFVSEGSSHSRLLPHGKMSCLQYFTLTHWSSAAQVHDLELQPGISEIPERWAGSVLPCLSAATLHGFSPQGTGSHVIETGGHRFVNLSLNPFLSGWHIAFWLPVSGGMHLEKLLIAIPPC